MLLTDIEFHEASSLKEASQLMARYAPDARFMAGGTDLLVDLKKDRFNVNHVVIINRIGDLSGVRTDNGGIRIGALTTPNQLAASAVIRERFSPILDATKELAAPQVRNMATVGGNLACAVPSGDLPPILMALNASVVLWSPSGEREAALEDFFTGPRQTIRRDDEILTAIRVPNPPPRFGAAYARFALREANACAVAAVAASVQLDDKRAIKESRICLGAAAPTPQLVHSARSLLLDKTVDGETLRRAAEAAMEAARPISDIRGSADYRRELVGILTQRALISARQRALGRDQ